MIYWLWFVVNGLISLSITIAAWPAKMYAQHGEDGNFPILFAFLPAWFIFTFTTLASLVLMYVPGRRNRVILYGVLFVLSNVSALLLQHSVTGGVGCLLYSVIGIGLFVVSRTLFYKSEYYDPSRR